MTVTVLHGDCRAVLPTLPAASVQCCVTSPRNANGQFVKGRHAYRQPQPHWERDWLVREYQQRGRSCGDIAQQIGCTDANVLFWLRRHNIPRRTTSEARGLKRWGVTGADNPMFGKTGEQNPRYVDGSSPERQRLYAQGAGREFIRSVLARDGFQCRRCGTGKTTPKSLHAHHIAPWAGNPALRFDAANAVTLCRPCHSWVHSKANVAREWLA